MSGGEISSEGLRRDECSCRCHPLGQVAHASTAAVPTQPVVHVHTTLVMQSVPEQLVSGTPKLPIAKRDGGTVHRQFHDGVGATLNTVHMDQGVWDQTMSDSKSINWLELKTVHLAILHFLDLLKNRSVTIRSDNLAMIYNLDKQLSRSHKAIPTEWSLCPRVFRAIARELGDPGIDLFATALNHQTLVYISPCPDPNALALDALSVDWSTLPLAYGFPPMPILLKVIQKIRQ